MEQQQMALYLDIQDFPTSSIVQRSYCIFQRVEQPRIRFFGYPALRACTLICTLSRCPGCLPLHLCSPIVFTFIAP